MIFGSEFSSRRWISFTKENNAERISDVDDGEYDHGNDKGNDDVDDAVCVCACVCVISNIEKTFKEKNSAFYFQKLRVSWQLDSAETGVSKPCIQAS